MSIFLVLWFMSKVLHYSLKALLGGLPVDYIPDGLEVLGLAVLVLEANDFVSSYSRPQECAKYLLVSVLPGINAEDGSELPDDRVLILGYCISSSVSIALKLTHMTALTA